jgi:hypothetical protein
MRPGCAGLSSNDGVPGRYAFLPIVTSADGPPSANAPAGSGINGCARAAGRVVRLRYSGVRIVRADVYINGKRVTTARGQRLAQVTIPPAGATRHVVKIVLRASNGRRYTSVRTYDGCKKTRPRRVRR